jgi:hypothetical protein
MLWAATFGCIGLHEQKEARTDTSRTAEGLELSPQGVTASQTLTTSDRFAAVAPYLSNEVIAVGMAMILGKDIEDQEMARWLQQILDSNAPMEAKAGFVTVYGRLQYEKKR